MNLYTVGRAAGVSRTVVSLVINGKADRHGIARRTQDKVREAVRRLGYVPDRTLHRMFRQGQLGLDPDTIRNMDTTLLLARLAPVLAEKGYRIVAMTERVGGRKPESATPEPIPTEPERRTLNTERREVTHAAPVAASIPVPAPERIPSAVVDAVAPEPDPTASVSPEPELPTPVVSEAEPAAWATPEPAPTPAPDPILPAESAPAPVVGEDATTGPVSPSTPEPIPEPAPASG